MVCRQLVGSFPKHLVVQCIRVYLDVSADKIVHLDNRVLGHLEADGPAIGGLQQLLDLVLRQCQGVAQFHAGLLVVDEGVAGSLCLGAFRIQFLSRVECIISISVFDELVSEFAVDALSL